MKLIIYQYPTPIKESPSFSSSNIKIAESGEIFSCDNISDWIYVFNEKCSGFIHYNQNNHIIVEDWLYELLKTDANIFLKNYEDYIFLDAKINDDGVYKFGIDYNLGDIITIRIGEIEQHSRIVEVAYIFNNSHPIIIPTFEKYKEKEE